MMSINVQTTISDREHAVRTIDSRSPYKGWSAKKRDIRLGCCHVARSRRRGRQSGPCHLLSRSGYITWKMTKLRQIAATDAEESQRGKRNRKVETGGGKTQRERREEKRRSPLEKERGIDHLHIHNRFERELSSRTVSRGSEALCYLTAI